MAEGNKPLVEMPFRNVPVGGEFWNGPQTLIDMKCAVRFCKTGENTCVSLSGWSKGRTGQYELDYTVFFVPGSEGLPLPGEDGLIEVPFLKLPLNGKFWNADPKFGVLFCKTGPTTCLTMTGWNAGEAGEYPVSSLVYVSTQD